MRYTAPSIACLGYPNFNCRANRILIRWQVSKMGHAKSLRVIGQCLDTARVSVFEVEKNGQNYLLSVDSVSKAGEWILRNALDDNALSQALVRSADNRRFCFNPADIARLDIEAQRQRDSHSSANAQPSNRLSQALRALGDHLDITEVTSFRLSWKFDDAAVDYQERDGECGSRTFTTEKLERLGFHSRFRRSGVSRYGFPGGKNLRSSDKLDTPKFPDWSPARSDRLQWKFPRGFKQNKNKK